MTALATSHNHRRLCDYYSPMLVASEIPIPKKLVSYVGLASGTRESVEKTIHRQRSLVGVAPDMLVAIRHVLSRNDAYHCEKTEVTEHEARIFRGRPSLDPARRRGVEGFARERSSWL
jgi:hypothetical protein